MISNVNNMGELYESDFFYYNGVQLNGQLKYNYIEFVKTKSCLHKI